jgi:cytochrome c oxidase subunit 2
VGGFNFGLPDALTQTAKDIDSLFGMVFWITLVVFVLVEGLLAFFLIRYKRTHPDKQGYAIHGSTKAEVIWTLIPAMILVFIGVWSSGMVYTIQTPPADVYEIKVTGMKWAWEFEYPNGAKSYGEVHLPKDRNVMFKITSKDVIHSFWIPEFRMKQDAVPGRMTSFTVRMLDEVKAGTKLPERIVCAEYCGDNHSKMLANIVIEDGKAFDTWVAAEKDRKKTDAASVIQANGCTSCHTIDGGKSAGPTWKGLGSTHDEAYIKESITNPNAKIAAGFQPGMMPAFTQLDEESLNNVVKYIQSLK